MSFRKDPRVNAKDVGYGKENNGRGMKRKPFERIRYTRTSLTGTHGRREGRCGPQVSAIGKTPKL